MGSGTSKLPDGTPLPDAHGDVTLPRPTGYGWSIAPWLARVSAFPFLWLGGQIAPAR